MGQVKDNIQDADAALPALGSCCGEPSDCQAGALAPAIIRSRRPELISVPLTLRSLNFYVISVAFKGKSPNGTCLNDVKIPFRARTSQSARHTACRKDRPE